MEETIHTKKKTLPWFAAGLLLSLMVLLTVFNGLAGTVSVTDPAGIPETVDAVMACARNEDWNTLGLLISGTPTLDPVILEADTPEGLIWNAYRESLRWVCEERFSVQGSHVTQAITVTCLDICETTKAMSRALPESATDSDKSELLQSALREAARQILDDDPPTMQQEITLTLVREKGRWKVISDKALLKLLSGFTVP